jgi:geranylgeranyl pyrophosphate synthase
MTEQEFVTILTQKLEQSISEISDDEQFCEILKYSLLPPGKLFRSRLVFKFLAENNQYDTKDLFHFCLALEYHHTYTLVHDDLPCMDNDDYRRGKLTIHKKYNEWTAVLVGDALLNASYYFLTKMEAKKSILLSQLMSRNCGASGLILGQFYDLSHKNKTLEENLLLHELKTSRLIQLALVGANILSENTKSEKKIFELGKIIGINFQLIDDVEELKNVTFSQQEAAINAFVKFDKNEVKNYLDLSIKKSLELAEELSLYELKNFIADYYTSKLKY